MDEHHFGETIMIRKTAIRFLGIVSILMGLGGSFSAHAMKADMKFQRLSREDGLSMSTITCILQDRMGFMWFGTEDGLNRFNGYEFTVYRYAPDNPATISNNVIYSILEDKDGILWVGTEDGGLNQFDPRTETFSAYRHHPLNPKSLSHDAVVCLYEDRRGGIWIGTEGGGLNFFDKKNKVFEAYRNNPNDPRSLSSDNVTSIAEDRHGILWIGTINGLNRMDENGFTVFKHDPENPNSLSHNEIRSLYIDKTSEGKNILWIGTIGGGLNKFDGKHFTVFTENEVDENGLHNNSVWEIYKDRDGTLWVGTDGGLHQFDGDRFKVYQRDPDKQHSLSNNHVTSVYEDNGGVLWVGTINGLNKHSRKKFNVFQHDPDDPNSLSGASVFSFYEDRHGFLWVGTAYGGLNKMDGQKFSAYKNVAEDPDSLSHNTVASITGREDRKGKEILWIGTFGGGLNRFDGKKFSVFRHDPYDPNSLSNNFILTMIKDRNDDLWIGTKSGGLNKFDPDTGKFTVFQHDPFTPDGLSDNFVTSIHEDRKGILWIGTGRGGLNRFDGRHFTIFKPNPKNPGSLSDNFVRCIHEDRSGTIWVGTEGGLNKMNPDNSFTHFREKDGLPNDIVYGILEDDAGNLWLSTNNGLSKFDPRTREFRNYDVEDGLQSNQFVIGSYYKSPDGKMYFGGINGYNTFYPDEIKDNPFIPPIVITNFLIFNKPVKIGKNSTLQESILLTAELQLSYKDYVFSFEFAALSYSVPDKNRYQYKMEGFEKEWNVVNSKRRFATYTNLPAGFYTFYVKGSNNDGIWNDTGQSIQITVTPPFWRTWWFRLLVSLTCLASIILFFQLRTYAIRRRNRELQDQITERQKAEEELRKSKAFLDNIINALDDPFFVTDENYRWVILNDKACMILNRTRQELIQKTVFDGFTSDISADLHRMDIQVFKDGRTNHGEEKITWNGKIHSVSIKKLLFKEALTGDKFILTVFRDITERKLSEEKILAYQKRLQHLASELSVAEERERRHISTDLHDGVGQDLAAVKFKLRRLQEGKDAIEESMPEIIELLNNIIESIRSLTVQLSPPMLHDLGLEAALGFLAENFEKRYHIPVFFEDVGYPKTLNENTRAFLYRAASELLNNIAKHAKARYGKIVYTKKKNRIELSVEDNGLGFDSSNTEKINPNGFGLFSIQERLSAMGGCLMIDSKPGRGTKITIVTPHMSTQGETIHDHSHSVGR